MMPFDVVQSLFRAEI